MSLIYLKNVMFIVNFIIMLIDGFVLYGNNTFMDEEQYHIKKIMGHRREKYN